MLKICFSVFPKAPKHQADRIDHSPKTLKSKALSKKRIRQKQHPKMTHKG